MYLKPTDAALQLQVGKTALYKLLQERKIRHIRVGGSIRIPPDAIDEFIRENTIVPVRHASDGSTRPISKQRRKLIQKHLG